MGGGGGGEGASNRLTTVKRVNIDKEKAACHI